MLPLEATADCMMSDHAASGQELLTVEYIYRHPTKLLDFLAATLTEHNCLPGFAHDRYYDRWHILLRADDGRVFRITLEAIMQSHVRSDSTTQLLVESMARFPDAWHAEPLDHNTYLACSYMNIKHRCFRSDDGHLLAVRLEVDRLLLEPAKPSHLEKPVAQLAAALLAPHRATAGVEKPSSRELPSAPRPAKSERGAPAKPHPKAKQTSSSEQQSSSESSHSQQSEVRAEPSGSNRGFSGKQQGDAQLDSSSASSTDSPPSTPRQPRRPQNKPAISSDQDSDSPQHSSTPSLQSDAVPASAAHQSFELKPSSSTSQHYDVVHALHENRPSSSKRSFSTFQSCETRQPSSSTEELPNSKRSVPQQQLQAPIRHSNRHFVMEDLHHRVIQSCAYGYQSQHFKVGRRVLSPFDMCSLGRKRVVSGDLLDAYFDLVTKHFALDRIKILDSEVVSLLAEMDYEEAALQHGIAKGEPAVGASIADLDLILMPTQMGDHWTSVAIDVKHQQLHHFDSKRTQQSSQMAFKLGRKLLQAEFAVEEVDFGLQVWTERDDERFPQQANTYDGGIFAAQAIRQLCQSHVSLRSLTEQSWNFDQEDIDGLRWHMWLEVTARQIHPLPV